MKVMYGHLKVLHDQSVCRGVGGAGVGVNSVLYSVKKNTHIAYTKKQPFYFVDFTQ